MSHNSTKNKKKYRHSLAHRIIKAVRYVIGLRMIKIFFSLPSVMSLSRALSLSKLIVKVGYYFAGEYRKQVFTNLRLYYGKEKSFSELKEMAEEIGIEATKGAFEAVYSVSPRKGELYSKIEIEGREHLDAALNKGKGVIALSAHLGNFAVMGGRLIAEGYPFYLVLKLSRDSGIANYFTMQMEQHRLNFILADPATVAQKEIIRTLRKNGIVGLIVDGDQKLGGVPVKLMGQEIAMPTGPAIIARRVGAIVLPMFIIRQEDNKQKIIIEPPVELIEDEDQERAIALLCQKFAGIIESYIRMNPNQWYWINKKHTFSRIRKRIKPET